MSKTPTTPYLTGFDVKPSSINPIGTVTFTDGTNEVTPNQVQCEAYGYKYNKVTRTCSAFKYSSNLDRNISNINNKINGAGNITLANTDNTYIIGQKNTVRGDSTNNIVVGTQNEIANGVSNANVYGTLGEATADNSIVLGGNVAEDLLGERQSIQVIYGIQTTNGTNTVSYLNNTTDKLLAVPENAVMYFHADVIAVRVGGTGTGNLGDYASWVERGVIINESGTLSVSRERDAIKSNGTVTNWQPTGIASGTNFAMRVRGATDVTIEWCSNITFTQIKTGVAL
mgnify:CR=1 FL=1|tara:strand:+ start:4653 stop:5507 length:855 start_codon:yes stop_codon:yes gene_type:complete